MALAKSFTLNSGATGDYIRLVTFRWDRSTREAVALYALYVNAAAAQSGKEPLSPFIAKLRLTGDKFDQYLGNLALAQADVVAQLYVAAKAEPLACDFGADAFADAADV